MEREGGRARVLETRAVVQLHCLEWNDKAQPVRVPRSLHQHAVADTSVLLDLIEVLISLTHPLSLSLAHISLVLDYQSEPRELTYQIKSIINNLKNQIQFCKTHKLSN